MINQQSDGRLIIYDGGLQTTLQDDGRGSFMAYGVSRGGAMDQEALRAVNLLLANEPFETGLEITLIGPELSLEADRWIALGGADIEAYLDDQRIPMWQPVFVRAGQRLRLGKVRGGARAYMAIDGGFHIEELLGGCGTDLRSGFGGGTGRALKAGDGVPLGISKLAPVSEHHVIAPIMPCFSLRSPKKTDVLRVLPGLEFEEFATDQVQEFISETYEVGIYSDRMGIRLKGKSIISHRESEMISAGVTFGTVQIPADGQPILLGADAQTTGGYPRIAQVVEADLCIIGQLKPGDTVRFVFVSLEEALQLMVERECQWQQFMCAVQWYWKERC